MKILVIGSGGREHALCWKLRQSELVDKIYCAPGNGGTGLIAENILLQANDIEGLLEFAKREKIDLTVVGPEEPLVLGIVDLFKSHNLKIFGPDSFGAKLEGSKDFAKDFMVKYDIPTANYKTFYEFDSALKGIENFSYPLVIKADGLCLGKGVVICEDKKAAENTLDDILKKKVFGKEGTKVVVEEFLHGVEASLLCFVSHNKLFPMESAKDYKQIYEDDKGPNTGGVGCFSPSHLFNESLKRTVKTEILDKIEIGLEKEGHDYTGILFIGFMIDEDIPKVMEFNARFGDPETEVVIPRLESDLLQIFLKAIEGDLKERDIAWNKEPCVTVVLTSKGYPGEYIKGYTISGLNNLPEDIIVFHNGTKKEGDEFITNGGRVLSITSLGKTEEARIKIYKTIEKIDFDGLNFRKDIALLK
ncbi:MAG: phosphoribosylamine--glycine ligase [Gudongella sp.]|nr:phosphoribosylamine--glycine ligase [Gudongella sp.]